MIKFSVIIVSYNSLNLLINCLNSIYKAASDDVEIIVVDNNSNEEVIEYLENQDKIILIKNTSNVGFGKANNQAAKLAKGKWFVLINNDTKVELDFFEKAAQFFQSYPSYNIMGPLVLSADGFPQPTFYNKDYYRQLIFPSYSFRKFVRVLTFGTNVSEKKNLLYKRSVEYSFVNTHEVDSLSGVCLFIDRKVYETVGLFDENYFMYVEDLDFCLNVKRRGYKIAFFPELIITHFIKNINQKPSISWFNYNKNLKYFFSNNFAWYINIVAQPVLSLKALTKYFITRIRAKK